MPVLKLKEGVEYTQIHNSLVEKLDIDTLGALMKMVQLPPRWEFNKTDLQTRLGVGREKLENITKKLKEAGALRIASVRQNSGVFDGWLWEVAAFPAFLPEYQNTEKPEYGLTVTRLNRSTVNPYENTNENEEERNKEEKEEKNISPIAEDLALQKAVAKLRYQGAEKIALPNETEWQTVIEVFEFWKLHFALKPNTKLTPERARAVLDRLRSPTKWNLEDIRQAIIGNSRSPHHNGANEKGANYNDLELICRTDQKLVMNIGYAEENTAKGTTLQNATNFKNTQNHNGNGNGNGNVAAFERSARGAKLATAAEVFGFDTIDEDIRNARK